MEKYKLKIWTKEEDKILKKHYPNLGSKVQQFLPDRTKNAIDHRVRVLGIRYGLFNDEEEAFLDIETTNLKADFAFMLSYSIKTKSKDEILFSVITREEILSGQLDKRLIKDLIRDLRKYKRIYTYYGSRFDIPFCRTRALAHGFEFIPFGLIQHQDLYYLVRSKFKLSRNRLENICNLLGIEGKTHLEPKIWIMANTGDKKALQYILEHNKADVEILERLYNKIKIYASIQRTSM